jgi:redox-sensitive bicupin YhaK (pirin superfamily)
MSIYRVYAGPEGESHIEEIYLAQHPELGALMHVAQVGIHEFPELRKMDFHPLPERRLIIHLRGEVEIGVSDGSKQIFRPGDARLMEDTSGRGHTHQDLSPVIQAVVVLKD